MNAKLRQAAWFGLMAAALAGCGRSGPKIKPPEYFAYPLASLSVKLSGKPVPDAIVEFHAKEGKSPSVVSHFDSEADCYKFVTIEGNEKIAGVPEGEYTVTVKPGRNTRVSIPAKYGSPQTSGLTVEVKEGNNSLPPIELKS